MDINELQRAFGDGDNAKLFEEVKEKLGGAADLGSVIAALKEKLGSAASGNSLIESLQNMLAEDADGDGSTIDDMLEKLGFSGEQADAAASMFDRLKGFFGFGSSDESEDLAQAETEEEEPEDDGSSVEVKFDDVE